MKAEMEKREREKRVILRKEEIIKGERERVIIKLMI